MQVGTPAQAANQVLDGSPLDRLLFSCLLIIGLIIIISRSQRAGRLLRANGPILLFFLYCAVSILWSDYADVAFKRWTRAVGDLVMVLIVLSDAEPLAAFKRLLARLAYVLIPLSILFIKYYPSLGVYYSPWGGPGSHNGIASSKNKLGAICLCLGLGALWRLLTAYQDPERTGQTRRKMAQAVILTMVLWLFWIANSMTALACFLMASALLLATNSRAVIRRPAVVHLLMALMLAVSVSVLFFGVSPNTMATLGRDPTLTGRTEVWGWLFSLVQNPLLGTGFESYWLGPRLEKLWSVYWWQPTEAHNGYIEVYLNLGWIGVILLAWVLATGYRKVIAAYRRKMPLSTLALAYFLVGLTYNFTEAAFFRMLAPVWIFLLFAVVHASAYSDHEIKASAQNMRQHGGIYREDLVADVVLK
jgi:O-antigen ligase